MHNPPDGSDARGRGSGAGLDGHVLRELTRRQALHGGLIGIGALSGFQLLAACGGDEPEGQSSGAAATATKPDVTRRYDPDAPAGTPAGLPRVMGFVQPAPDPFWSGITRAFRMGCEDTGLEFKLGTSNGDPARVVDLMNQHLAQGSCGMVVPPYAPPAQKPIVLQGLEKGLMMIAINTAPGTMQVQGNEPELGTQMATTAAEFINEELGGEAQVAYFNQDNVESLRGRSTTFRKVLQEKAPGARIVQDITSTKNNADEGFQFMDATMTKHRDVRVVLGPGLMMMGVLASFEASKKDPTDWFLAGIGGTPQEVEAVRKPSSAFKATFGSPWNQWSYMWARFIGEWNEGKSVPMAMSARTVVLTSLDEKILDDFLVTEEDPRASWESGRSLKDNDLFGNINYDQREQYLTEVWTPPQ